MLQNWTLKRLSRIPVKVRLIPWLFDHLVGFLVRHGQVPHLIKQDEIMKALRATKPSGVLEMFGILKVRVRRAATGLWEDYGVVSTKKVTTAFANFVVDAFADSTTYKLDTFKYHQMGDDNTSDANTQTDLLNAREAKVAGTQTENGANIYQSVATINASAGYTVQEHSITNNTANATGVMLDRNLVPNAPTVIANDSVEFTYELTVNAES